MGPIIFELYPTRKLSNYQSIFRTILSINFRKMNSSSNHLAIGTGGSASTTHKTRRAKVERFKEWFKRLIQTKSKPKSTCKSASRRTIGKRTRSKKTIREDDQKIRSATCGSMSNDSRLTLALEAKSRRSSRVKSLSVRNLGSQENNLTWVKI